MIIHIHCSSYKVPFSLSFTLRILLFFSSGRVAGMKKARYFW
jgi:hypothetical protein